MKNEEGEERQDKTRTLFKKKTTKKYFIRYCVLIVLFKKQNRILLSLLTLNI